jgi:cell wall-associated NlpC family hydrolase
VRTPDDPAFATLRPGDLLFWAGTYQPSDGRASSVSHVQIYLGRESRDGEDIHVMAGSTDGRTYRGTQRCGYGVYDFRLPGPGSKSTFAGFGPPPGLDVR